MSENKMSQQDIIHVFSSSILLLVFLAWFLLLFILNSPLKVQQQNLDKQLKQIQLLRELPAKWGNQINYPNITPLMNSINKNWQQTLAKKYGNLQLQQVSKIELQAKVNKIDEFAFMQWLWSMQQQYSFQVAKLIINPEKEPAVIDVQVNLQLLSSSLPPSFSSAASED